MISTDYPATTGLKSPFSRGYADSASSMNTDVTTLVSPTVAGGAGAVVSSVGDLVTWASALARGQLVSDSLHARQLTPVVASGTTGYGLGVETFSHWVGHSGEFPGYEASMYSRPEVGTIVVLVNKTPTTVSASYAIFNELRWAEFGLK
jgi:D-alanyl-D-alanine carboxypeptidase